MGSFKLKLFVWFALLALLPLGGRVLRLRLAREAQRDPPGRRRAAVLAARGRRRLREPARRGLGPGGPARRRPAAAAGAARPRRGDAAPRRRARPGRVGDRRAACTSARRVTPAGARSVTVTDGGASCSGASPSACRSTSACSHASARRSRPEDELVAARGGRVDRRPRPRRSRSRLVAGRPTACRSRPCPTAALATAPLSRAARARVRRARAADRDRRRGARRPSAGSLLVLARLARR